MLLGANINVDRPSNTIWIEGQGQLRATPTAMSNKNPSQPNVAPTQQNTPQNTSGNNLAKLFAQTANANNSQNQGVIVDWKGGMEFNGSRQLVTFKKEVDVSYSLGSINKSDEVILRLSKPFRFFENDNPNDIELELVTIKGNIDIERDSFASDNSGQISREHLKCTALEINPNSGFFKGYGPGFVESVFKANAVGNAISSPSGNSSGNSLVAGQSIQNDAFKSPLKYLYCSFNGSVEGNFNANGSSFDVTFNDRVRTILYPAQTFRDKVNVNNAKEIVTKGVRLECNQLTVNQKTAPGNNAAMIELKTSGNTALEFAANGKNYIANTDRIKYDQGKNTITFEGNSYADAVLYESAGPSARSFERFRGKKFEMNLLTNDISSEGVNGTFLR
jgi:lipopolysaccharide export system protein LptA